MFKLLASNGIFGHRLNANFQTHINDEKQVGFLHFRPFLRHRKIRNQETRAAPDEELAGVTTSRFVYPKLIDMLGQGFHREFDIAPA